jgi:uncharacterized membrane protein (DUF4010 family)
MARQARAGAGPALPALGVLLANLTMLVRLGIMAAVVQPRLLAGLGTVVGLAALSLAPMAIRLLPRARRETAGAAPAVRNPTDLRVAIGFGVAYGVVSLLAAWSAARLGDAALYGVAAVSGLTDIDAIALSTFRLFGDTRIGEATAVAVVAIAMVSNLVFKAAVARSAGTRELGRECAIGFASMGLAIGAGVWLVR